MFTKKDYMSYLKSLYSIEIEMKKEIEAIMRIIDNKDALKIAERIRDDEIRHAGIVQDLMKLL